MTTPLEGITLSATPGRVHSAAPTLGQHSEEILQTLGYSTTEIAALCQAQVI